MTHETKPCPTCPWCNVAPTIAGGGAVMCENPDCPVNPIAGTIYEWCDRRGVDAAVAEVEQLRLHLLQACSRLDDGSAWAWADDSGEYASMCDAAGYKP